MRCGERVHRVAQAVLLAHALEQAGRHAAAKDGAEQVHCESVLADERHAREGQAQVILLDLLVLEEQAGLVGCRSDDVFALALHFGEQLFDEIQIFIGKVAGNRNHRILRTVILAHVLVQRLRGHRLKRFRRAENRTAECRAVIAALEQLVNGYVFWRVLVHVDLLENDTALEFQVLLRKAGVQEHIRQQRHRVFQSAVQHLHIVACAFLIRECVGLSA